ncbi:hypothetical protein C8J57DRAFT_1235945 [Mycena rebaudengoi]|nr:hypothetical protein C8J57DRAFT_1235945 [Mycena rebaudengoi]
MSKLSLFNSRFNSFNARLVVFDVLFNLRTFILCPMPIEFKIQLKLARLNVLTSCCTGDTADLFLYAQGYPLDWGPYESRRAWARCIIMSAGWGRVRAAEERGGSMSDSRGSDRTSIQDRGSVNERTSVHDHTNRARMHDRVWGRSATDRGSLLCAHDRAARAARAAPPNPLSAMLAASI